MKSIKAIASELRDIGQGILSSKIMSAIAADLPLTTKTDPKYVELVPISKQELTDMTKKAKKPLGLLLNEMGLKQAHKAHKVKVAEPLKYVNLKEDNMDLIDKHAVLVFKKEEPFQLLNEYYRHKADRGEPLVNSSIFVKQSSLDE